jgi:hypothetical protein
MPFSDPIQTAWRFDCFRSMAANPQAVGKQLVYTRCFHFFLWLWRPQIPMQTQVLDILHSYLTQHKGPAFDFFPEVNLHPNDRTLNAIILELAKGWQKMSTQTEKAYRDVRRWRKNPHPILQFAPRWCRPTIASFCHLSQTPQVSRVWTLCNHEKGKL